MNTSNPISNPGTQRIFLGFIRGAQVDFIWTDGTTRVYHLTAGNDLRQSQIRVIAAQTGIQLTVNDLIEALDELKGNYLKRGNDTYYYFSL